MIDIHSHILPNIDDGAGDIDKTIEMLEIASKRGIKKVVATPHYYRGYYENNYEDICRLIEKVNIIKQKRHLDVEIFPGQEVFLDKYTLELYNSGIIRGINNTKYILVEFQMDSKPKDALNTLYELKLLGLVPIVAHPERYKYIIEKPSIINEFIDEKCLFQINSGSMTGLFGKQVQKLAEILVNNRICHFIASDAHSSGRRCPELETALNIVEGINNSIKRKVMDNANSMINNADIDGSCEKIKEKKSIFSFFRK